MIRSPLDAVRQLFLTRRSSASNYRIVQNLQRPHAEDTSLLQLRLHAPYRKCLSQSMDSLAVRNHRLSPLANDGNQHLSFGDLPRDGQRLIIPKWVLRPEPLNPLPRLTQMLMSGLGLLKLRAQPKSRMILPPLAVYFSAHTVVKQAVTVATFARCEIESPAKHFERYQRPLMKPSNGLREALSAS